MRGNGEWNDMNNKLENLDQLKIWLEVTFNHVIPPKDDNIINKAYNIWNSEYKEDLLNLIEWIYKHN